MIFIFKKVGRFIRSNGLIKVRLAAIAILAVAAVVLIAARGGQLKELKKVKAEKALVDRIPEFSSKARAKDLARLKPENQVAAIQNILEGTSYRDGVYHAVIDGVVYREGDMLGDYQIVRITMASIVITNAAAKDTRTLYFPGYSAEVAVTGR